MPIDTTHDEAAAWQTRWKRCRDAVAGQHAVHQAGEVYLPKLRDQTPDEYRAYRERAGWYGATGRTLQGLVGMVFRRAPALEVPPALDAMAADMTLSGHSVDLLARDTLAHVLEVGRIGLLVEYPAAPDAGPVTLAQAQALGRRPYVTTWAAETIINWRTARVNNRVQPVLVVLSETAEELSADPFKPARIPQLRALMLEAGQYLQRVYRKDAREQWVQHGADIVPMRSGAPMSAIPFEAVGPEELSLRVQKPPMLDLADTNIGHYKNTADLEHGAHFAGLPTPVVSGYSADPGEKLCIGSATAWVFPDPNAKAQFLEFTGQGLGALEARCKAKEAHMASLGARMLAPEKSGVESGDALSSRHNGEHSTLAGWAGLVSEAMERVLHLMAEWEGIAGDISYKLSTDYAPAGLTAQDLTALVAAWQGGAISWETLFFNLKEGEVVAADTDEADERDRIDAAGPPLGVTPPPGGSGGTA
jgi:hypothetical protein